MAKKEERTVIFRREALAEDGNMIVAVFPFLPWISTYPIFITAYTHEYGYCGASTSYFRQFTKLAKPEEYKQLKHDLEQNYKLNILEKWPRGI